MYCVVHAHTTVFVLHQDLLANRNSSFPIHDNNDTSFSGKYHVLCTFARDSIANDTSFMIGSACL
jgi:hypothetical protein